MVADLPVDPPVDPLDHRLDALRAAGAPQREPVRFQVAAALARRRLGQAGALRQRLDARLTVLLDALQQRLAEAPAAMPERATAVPGPLAQLCAGLQGHQGAVEAALPALRAVQQFGTDWARLRVQAQLHRAGSRPQGQAGPLNSRRLMLQTLQRLQRLSPAYLQRFMAHAETLLWLDDLGNAATGASEPAGPRPASAGPRRRGPLRRPPR